MFVKGVPDICLTFQSSVTEVIQEWISLADVWRQLCGTLKFVFHKYSHRETYQSMDRSQQNKRWTVKPPLYNHV